MPATVTRISVTPVKGLALHHPDAVELTAGGVPGDRTFFLVDAGGHMVSATRLGALVSVRAEHDVDAGTLSLAFADGGVVSAPVEADEPVPVRFYGRPLGARPLRGPFSGCALRARRTPGAAHAAAADASGGRPRRAGRRHADLVRVAASSRRSGGRGGGRRAPLQDDVPDRRPRAARRGRMGRARGHDRRRPPASQRSCRPLRPHHAQPETGAVDLPTLHVLYAYRGHVQSTEPLPFGVAAAVVQPGRVRLGDVVSGPRPATAAAPPTRPPAR
jgi:hypothetical protein